MLVPSLYRWPVAISTRLTTDAMDSFVPWRPGLVLPAHFSVSIDDDDLDYLVALDVEVDPGGEPVCASVRISRRGRGAPGVTPRGLRSTRLGMYLDHACASAAWTVERREGSIVYHPRESYPFPEPRERPPVPHTRLTDEKLREVAQVYRDAVAARRRPRVAIENDRRWAPMGKGVAARWVSEARKRTDPLTGETFLAPTVERRTGGTMTRKGPE